MKIQSTLPILAASLAAAQGSGNTPSLVEALASKNDTLSTLNGKTQEHHLMNLPGKPSADECGHAC
jgi:hypothetical protein